MVKKIIKKTISYFIFNKLILRLIASILIIYEKKIDECKGEIIKRKLKHIGKNCIFKGKVIIHEKQNLSIGDGVSIGEGSFLHCIGGIEIGENTQISRNVLIYSGNHDTDGKAIPYDENYIRKRVIIGESVWIGMNVIITPGVHIGNGAIIGMGTVISKDVPAGAVVVGASQRIVKYRDMEKFNKFKKENKLFFKIGLKNEI